MQRLRGEPRVRGLGKSEERRIVAVLSRIPDTEPEVEIRPLSGAGFELDWREPPEFFLPLEVGAQGFCADYHADTRELLEATVLRVTRRVRVRGMWCVETRESGGVPMETGFSICWDGPEYYRIARRRGYRLGLGPAGLSQDERVEFPFPRHVGRPQDSASIAPEASDLPRPEGYYVLTIGGHEHECMRVLSVSRDPDDREDAILDDAYLSRAGRTVLLRRLESPGHVASLERLRRQRPKEAMPAQESAPDSQKRIKYEGIDFLPWFDILTDVSLVPLLKPPRRRRQPAAGGARSA